MRKRRHSPARAIEQPVAFETLDVSPLIDVGFLLLIFFLVTSSLRREETDLKTALAGTPNHEFSPVETYTVDIKASADGAIAVDGAVLASDPTERSMPAVVRELKVAKSLALAAGGPILVVIDADDELAHQRFADVLNALTAAEIENITLKGGL